jgi:tRNA dimethylallyltransferase
MANSGGSRPEIPVLTGPTGAGKTAVALSLLSEFPDLHIISADSRQIYKYLDIGTDKPPPRILGRYNFHLIDFVEPGRRYTAFDFVDDCRAIINDLRIQGKCPLICGGTGLYIKSLIDGIFEIPENDLTIRSELVDEAAEKGPGYLYEKLKAIDPQEARKIHPNNIRRVIRALEIYYITGKPKSELISSPGEKRNGAFKVFCLKPPREELYQRINDRVEIMFERGLLDEVKSLADIGLREKILAINVIGYNELFRYLDNKLTLIEARNLIKQNSRRFAKRQITWFHGMEGIIYVDSAHKAFESLKDFLKQP